MNNSTNADTGDRAALLTLSQAAQTLPHRPHPSALWRWARRGLRTRHGNVVRLRHVRIGKRIFVTREDLEAFGRAVAEADTEGEWHA